MATQLYPYGYQTPTAMLTKTQILAKQHVAMMDPEVMRRAFAMMDVAAKQGVKLGIGGAGRLDGEQDVLYRKRYTPNPIDLPPCDAGRGQYLNKCWDHTSGAAAARPGDSYHEATTPAHKALAIDWIGDMAWLTKNCKRFGFYNFPSSEAWHTQPIEVPAKRSNYNAVKHALKVFPLPQEAEPLPPPPTTPLPPPKPVPGLPFTPDNVVPGSKGESVFLCQTILRNCASQVLVVPNGVYDEATAAGIRNLQLFFGLKVDGRVGAQTWPVLISCAQTAEVQDPS